MHIEVQVALNFVISYLYNKLPRRRVNLFGEELEKALKDKFQGHWYPEKPFKGSAFRCLKTGDPIDQVLEKAARESGVPISDILENLPAELSVWVDPGEVSYRIGEKGAVKILFSEHHDHAEDSSSADREVTKTFNPEAQCFRPIDAVTNGLNGLNLSPKTSPQGTSPTSSTSPTFKGNLNTSPNVAAGTFLPRTQAPITFTTATFAQTKFGSTKLKTSSKRTSSSYRMSPTEFSNYIKQRAMQQQLHHSHGPANGTTSNHFGPIGQASPSRSLSPNPLTLGLQNDPFYFPTNLNGMGMYAHQFGNNSAAAAAAAAAAVAATNNHQNNGVAPRNIFDHFHPDTNGLYTNGGNLPIGSKFSSYMEPHSYYGLNNQQQQQQQQHGPPPLQQASQQLQQQQQQSQQQQQQQNQSHQQQNSAATNGVIGSNLNNNTNNTNNSNSAANNNNTSTSGISVSTSSVPTSASVVAQINNTTTTNNSNSTVNNGGAVNSINGTAGNQQQDTSKIMDGLNSFYSSTGPYQHLLVAN
ncbi:myb-like protein P [Condylostylus longicornis]|uniref:myb-like protein P n=1 Tax=Condylostylus longicornis TaxID=2530218 RepID=UPI00244E5B1F|nr:myb-like protein P [Condylostylus longicornis]XP_055383232.1 myb-like protein P [Condylostylus longicornis]XP_055383233.1 myb-like protein P [Condylostylus longicornis]